MPRIKILDHRKYCSLPIFVLQMLFDSKTSVLSSDIFNNFNHSSSIGFTNGCFDILHCGHLSSLYKASTMCSKLIVGINTDNSIRRLKGPSRPILNLQHRIAALESLSFIDQVIPFDEDTPIKLIEKIQPDILFKGADYKDKEVVGSEFVVQWRFHNIP